ncbi:MAG: hypothetical protein P8X73_11330 [Ignavibacteriaceae bacterium]
MLFIIFIMPLLFIYCDSNSYKSLDIDGKILLLEDLDGKEGRTDGNFCDIVAYDIYSGEISIITDDDYYDDHPSYSKALNCIFFESKRIGAHSLTGLTSASNIFSLNLESNIIEQVDNKLLRNRFPILLKDENSFPLVNHVGNKLIFRNGSDAGIFFSRLIVYDINRDSLYLLKDSLIMVTDYIWSFNDENVIYIAEHKHTLRDNRNFVATVNLSSKERQIILDFNNSRKYLGDCLENQLIYINETIPGSEFSLMIMDLLTAENREVTKLNRFGFDEITEPVFYDETNIFLICSNRISSNRADEDVYMLDLNTLNLKQITFTHNIKEELTYIR